MRSYDDTEIIFPTMKPLDLPKTKKPEEVGIIGGATGAVEIEVKDEPIDFSKVEIEPLFKDYVDFLSLIHISEPTRH